MGALMLHITGRRSREYNPGAFTTHFQFSTSPHPQTNTSAHQQASHLPSFIPHPFRAGFTLVELLVVISIMLLLLMLTATMLRPAGEGRRQREAARAINVYLAAARNRAMETGRPCGVLLRRFQNSPFVTRLEQCEVPPCFCGELETSVARLQVSAEATTITAQLSDLGLPTGIARPGDLMQFNGQGPYYRILPPPANPVDMHGYVVGNTVVLSAAEATQNPLVPWPTAPAWSPPVSYHTFRAPLKGLATPLQLPVATVVDLTASGVGTGYGGMAGADVTILFSPTGALECLYIGASRNVITEPIFLLVGKRERVGNSFVPAPSASNASAWPNYQDLNNIWVTVYPLTGVINTEPVASSAGATDELGAVNLSRSLARQALGMGGK